MDDDDDKVEVSPFFVMPSKLEKDTAIHFLQSRFHIDEEAGLVKWEGVKLGFLG